MGIHEHANRWTRTLPRGSGGAWGCGATREATGHGRTSGVDTGVRGTAGCPWSFSGLGEGGPACGSGVWILAGVGVRPFRPLLWRVLP